MKTYLVGGAVRDALLNLPVYDRDFVVVGATPDELISQGFVQIGKNFPVFLHPQTKEEYALARCERKDGCGYTGFICDFSPHISLEEDLIRRDLTINAIAQDEQGNYIDPLGGIDDLNNKKLRHCSSAFIEDPLRVLRVARLYAKLHHLGFEVCEKTINLMKKVRASGELHHLTAERIWQETLKALQTPSPASYFYLLAQVGAKAILFPEINDENLTFLRTAQKFKHHAQDPDAFLLGSLFLQKNENTQPLNNLDTFAKRLKISHNLQIFAALAQEYQQHLTKAQQLSAGEIITLFDHLDVWRKPQRFADLLLLIDAITQTPRTLLWEYFQISKSVDIQSIIKNGFTGSHIKTELFRQRVQLIKKKTA